MQHQVIETRPLPSVLTDLLPRYNRVSLEGFITEAIDYLDRLDGDADDADGNWSEEEPVAAFALMKDGPGCIWSDCDKGVDDECQDALYEDGI